MKRFHKKIYFPASNKLEKLNAELNSKKWQYSRHCLENLKYRALDLKKVLSYIAGLELQSRDIFEYYSENNNIIKVCYRIKYNDNIDIILVISNNKNIITLYYNSKNDKHYTLKENIYCKA